MQAVRDLLALVSRPFIDREVMAILHSQRPITTTEWKQERQGWGSPRRDERFITQQARLRARVERARARVERLVGQVERLEERQQLSAWREQLAAWGSPSPSRSS